MRDLARMSSEDSDDLENGGGFGLSIGWGFTPSVMLYATGNGASITGADGAPDYSLGHFDLGLRVTLADAASSWRPFLLGGVTGRAAVWDDFLQGDDLEVTGAAFTAGGGLSYFFSPAWALETTLQWSFGEFSEVKLGDRSANLDQFSFDATSTRFDLGVSWYVRGG